MQKYTRVVKNQENPENYKILFMKRKRRPPERNESVPVVVATSETGGDEKVMKRCFLFKTHLLRKQVGKHAFPKLK